MIEGFMASFIIGFLGTAGPRITSTVHFTRVEVVTLLTFVLLAAGLHFGGSHGAADAVFVFCLASFVVVLGRRFVKRTSSPPPNFALVGLGLFNGLVGSLLIALFEDRIYSTQYRIGALFLEQGFVLLPVLGVAPFFLSRLLGLSVEEEMPESRQLPSGWIKRAAFAAATGVLVDLTFIAESLDLTKIGGWTRVVVIVGYLVARMPRQGRSFLADCLRTGSVMLVLGVLVEAIGPQYRIGAIHIIFISGFSFIVLTVATRVIFGHSGQRHLLEKRLSFFVVIGLLIFGATLSRYVADLAPEARNIHLIGAAFLWLIAMLIWMGKVLPKVLVADPEG